jgi:hypothetical protein
MANTSGTLSTSLNMKLPTYADFQELVRRRAYRLYELRGMENGGDLEDWLQAESELRQQHNRGSPEESPNRNSRLWGSDRNKDWQQIESCSAEQFHACSILRVATSTQFRN